MAKFWKVFGEVLGEHMFVWFSSVFRLILMSVSVYGYISLRLYQYQFAFISVSVCAGSIITMYYKIMLNHHQTIAYYKNSDYLCIGVG